MRTNDKSRRFVRRAVALAVLSGTLTLCAPTAAFAEEHAAAPSALPGVTEGYGRSSLFADEGASEAAAEARKANASLESKVAGAIIEQIAKSGEAIEEVHAEAVAALEEQRRIEEERRLAEEAAAREASLRSSVADAALGYLGVPYVSGGSTPAGFDCSGLVRYCVLQALGIELPRTAAAQAGATTPVPFDGLQRGDLLFWGSGASVWHVGVYLGDGTYVHAPAPGQSVSVDTFQYFSPSFAGRIAL